MDTRGHGASDSPPRRLHHRELAADAVAVLDAAGAAKAAVAGVSMGGMTAMQMAVSTPERLTAIAICNSAADGSRRRCGWTGPPRCAANGMAPLMDGILARWFPPAVRAANPPYLSTAAPS